MTHGVAVSVRHEADGNLRYRVAFLVVVVDDRRFRGKGFQFRNQFANSVHDVLQYDGGV